MRNIIIKYLLLSAPISLSNNNTYSMVQDNISSKPDVIDSPFGLTESEHNTIDNAMESVKSELACISFVPELGHILDFTSSFNVIRNITGQVNNFGYKNFELDLFNNFTKQFNELVLHHNTIIDYIDKSSNVTINTTLNKEYQTICKEIINIEILYNKNFKPIEFKNILESNIIDSQEKYNEIIFKINNKKITDIYKNYTIQYKNYCDNILKEIENSKKIILAINKKPKNIIQYSQLLTQYKKIINNQLKRQKKLIK